MLIQSFMAVLAFTSILPHPAVSGYTPASMKSWCSQMPNPEPCEYFLTRDREYFFRPIDKKSDFFQLSKELALDRAMKAHANAYKLGSKCRNQLEKAAWTDCLELYKQAIKQLNMTLDPYFKSSRVDVQTWLSSAMTNLETCQAGFVDFGVIDYIFPMMNNNVSSLISNILAMNKVAHGVGKYKERFPTWVSSHDQKLLHLSSLTARADIVVSRDGSGDYKTVSEAVAAAGNPSSRFVIYVKAGIYKETVRISGSNIMLVGDGIGKTIITGSKSVDGGSTTFNSATVAVVGHSFIGQGLTIQNTAGAAKHQAVALRVGSDLTVFYQCSFEGYQDTLCVHSLRQFYRECDIYGTVDFIFGNAAVVFQNCNIHPRYPLNRTNTITAQGRTDPNQNTGISIHDCVVTAASDLKPYVGSVNTYLGRPWKAYSRTVFMKTHLDSLINPAGWMEWKGTFALPTLYYGEYMNTGPGSSTADRVKWPGFNIMTSSTVASTFTVGELISGTSWLKATNVPFTSGL